MRKTVIYNLIGSVFDKGLPLIITAFLNKFMTSDDYGQWALFYQFILIANAFCASPVLAFFSRKYFSKLAGEENNKLHIYNAILVGGMLMFCFSVYYLHFSPANYALLEVPTLLLFLLYGYLALFFRFNGKDQEYLKSSLLRLLIFALLVFLGILFGNKVSYNVIIGAFLIAHIPSFIISLKYVSWPKSIKVKEKKEFWYLSTYGLSTSLVNGMDKFVIVGAGLSYSFLGFYSFLYTLTNAPTIIVEALKKTLNPIMFKEFAQNGGISTKTKKKIFHISLIILGCQFTLPFLGFYLLKRMDLINPEFLSVGNHYQYIFILSLGFFFQGIYHFINPYYIFFKKTNYLLIIQVVSMLIYLWVLQYKVTYLNYEGLMWAKSLLFLLITFGCIIGLRKVKVHVSTKSV